MEVPSSGQCRANGLWKGNRSFDRVGEFAHGQRTMRVLPIDSARSDDVGTRSVLRAATCTQLNTFGVLSAGYLVRSASTSSRRAHAWMRYGEEWFCHSVLAACWQRSDGRNGDSAADALAVIGLYYDKDKLSKLIKRFSETREHAVPWSAFVNRESNIASYFKQHRRRLVARCCFCKRSTENGPLK